jgi:DNA modification methylase
VSSRTFWTPGLGGELPTPKRSRGSHDDSRNWFPYYAGFSGAFVGHVIQSLLNDRGIVLDPWNGSGTTTRVARNLKRSAYGFDLNPVMTLVAKSHLLSVEVNKSLLSLGKELARGKRVLEVDLDPLEAWFIPSSATHVRSVQAAVERALVGHDSEGKRIPFDDWTPLAAFYHVALFKACRELTKNFRTKNPSWYSLPLNPSQRVRPSRSAVKEAFLRHVRFLIDSHAPCKSGDPMPRVVVGTEDSSSLPLNDDSVNLVLTSPPYCTRIDYAVKTRLELAVLGVSHVAFSKLRRDLMGTTTISEIDPSPSSAWGDFCLAHLARIGEHPSKGSRTYYYKNHVQYFDRLYSSLEELARVLAPSGSAVLVVQDSWYKELHTDLARIVVDMAKPLGWRLYRQTDFRPEVTMSVIHGRGQPIKRMPTESVLHFVAA